MKLKKKSLATVFEYIILVCYIYGSTMAAWRYMPNKPLGVNTLTYILYGIVLIYAILECACGCVQLKRKHVKFIGGILVYGGVYSVLSRDFSSTFYLWFLLPLMIVCILVIFLREQNRVDNFFLEYSNTIIVLAVISLFLYFAGEILKLIPSKMATIVRVERGVYAIPSYFGLLFIGQTQTIFGTTFARNTGLFLEGPSWGGFLWPAFFVELFVRKKLDKKRCLILLTTVVTTFSLKGIAFCLVAIGIKYLSTTMRRENNKLVFNYRIVIIPLLLTGIGIISFLLLESKAVYEEGSIIARLDDISATFKAWISNPLTGCGFYNEKYIRSFMSFDTSRGNTAGLLKVFALGGIMIGLEYIGGIILFIKKGRGADLPRIVFGILLIINGMVSSVFNSMFSLFFVAYGLSYMIRIPAEREVMRFE